MKFFTTTGKVLATLAAAAALTVLPMPSMAGGEMPSRPCPPPCAPAPACAPASCSPAHCPSWFDFILYYPLNRVNDVLDIFRLNIGFGYGFGINVRATELLEVGVGQYESIRFGMKGRVLGTYEENICEGGVGFLGWVGGCLQRDPSEVGADIHLGIIGVQAAVSLVEVVDAVTSVFGLDIQGDDLGPTLWD